MQRADRDDELEDLGRGRSTSPRLCVRRGSPGIDLGEVRGSRSAVKLAENQIYRVFAGSAGVPPACPDQSAERRPLSIDPGALTLSVARRTIGSRLMQWSRFFELD